MTPYTPGARENAIEHAIGLLLDAIQPDWRGNPDFAATPQRVAKMYAQELCFGTIGDPPALTAFPTPIGMDQMIIVGPLVVHSLCPHHLAPIIGDAWIGVLPGGRLLGLSKYARIVRWCMARPAMQETSTEMIADHLERAFGNAAGVAVLVRAEHLCMKWRGVREPAAITTTSAMRGGFKDPAARAEFMRIARA